MTTESQRQHLAQLDRLADSIQLEAGHVVLLQSPVGAGKTFVARRLTEGLAFRAPHHTASRHCLGEELAMAAGGVLYLDEWLEHDPRNLRHLWWIWDHMGLAARPTVILGWSPIHDLGLGALGRHEMQWIRLKQATVAIPPLDHHLIWGF